MKPLDDKQIKEDNSHFSGHLVRERIEPASRPDNVDFGYTHTLVVGCTGNKYKAAYLWHPKRNRWELGMN